jgi:hypothetical protein
MSPRLLRPRATGGYDADAQAYFNAVAQADGQQLETAVKVAINNFILGCKADSVWPAITTSCILMGARTLSGALTPLVGPTPTGINLVAGDYDRKTGIKGNGVDKAIDTNRAGNADGQNDLHFAVYISEAHTGAANGAYIAAGNMNQTTASGVMRVGGGGANTVRIRGQSLTPAITIPRAFAGVRVDSTTAVAYGDVTITNASAGTATAVATDWWVLGNNSTGTTNQFPCDGRVAFYSIGSAISSNALLTRIASLYTAIGAAI